ncbi:hypothetical protein Nepgr_017357 [Nepenthes gracilis]|uniref:Uncharacterized protein n=1 Tax=Nepenthes gracilis TaxID=150966 RepID=A0AAD3SSH4_NEPGR|nr:hypothetical protein Nepgr_017357 [Nepenthes gracilis]
MGNRCFGFAIHHRFSAAVAFVFEHHQECIGVLLMLRRFARLWFGAVFMGHIGLLGCVVIPVALFEFDSQKLASDLYALASDLCCPCEMMRIHVMHLSVYILTCGRQDECNSHPRAV